MMNYIDESTIPFCTVKEKKFEWGEPYTIYEPIFKITPVSVKLSLKDSITIFGENNFKKQLLLLYNVINNHEEFEKIEYYDGEIFDRDEILKLIDFYIKENENYFSPWEKYNTGVEEIDYLHVIEENTQKKINYCNYY